MSAKSDHQFRYMNWRMLLWVFVCALQIALIASGVILPIFPFLQPLAVSNTVLSLISAGLVTLGAFIVDRIFSKLRHLKSNHYSRRPDVWSLLHACQFGVALSLVAAMLMLALSWTMPVVLSSAFLVFLMYVFVRMQFQSVLQAALVFCHDDKPSMRKWRVLLLFIGVRVNRIPDRFFRGRKKLTSYTMPDGVVKIGDYAFQSCRLTSIRLPDSVTSIGQYAFDDCTGLSAITMPHHGVKIGDYAFRECTSLTSMTIPDGVTSMGEGAFYGCASLTSVKLPDGIVSIPRGAFWECFSLISIRIPDSVTSIDPWAFGRWMSERCDSRKLRLILCSEAIYKKFKDHQIFNIARVVSPDLQLINEPSEPDDFEKIFGKTTRSIKTMTQPQQLLAMILIDQGFNLIDFSMHTKAFQHWLKEYLPETLLGDLNVVCPPWYLTIVGSNHQAYEHAIIQHLSIKDYCNLKKAMLGKSEDSEPMASGWLADAMYSDAAPSPDAKPPQDLDATFNVHNNKHSVFAHPSKIQPSSDDALADSASERSPKDERSGGGPIEVQGNDDRSKNAGCDGPGANR